MSQGTNPNAPRKTVRVRDLVSHRQWLKNVRQAVKPPMDVEFDQITAVWNDPFGHGRLALTAGGHIVHTEKEIGAPVTLIRRGHDWEEVG